MYFGMLRRGAFLCTTAAAKASAAAAASPASAGVSRGGAGAPLPELLLYNSMSRSKEVFRARKGQGNAVSMYVCGVTVYSMSHIGTPPADRA